MTAGTASAHCDVAAGNGGEERVPDAITFDRVAAPQERRNEIILALHR
ncbi:MAG: hypothetical protein ACI9B9_000228 [Halioglobus sp.]|jgi:hypothetical protein